MDPSRTEVGTAPARTSDLYAPYFSKTYTHIADGSRWTLYGWKNRNEFKSEFVSTCLSISLLVYTYVQICTCVCMHIYIYIYVYVYLHTFWCHSLLRCSCSPGCMQLSQNHSYINPLWRTHVLSPLVTCNTQTIPQGYPY